MSIEITLPIGRAASAAAPPGAADPSASPQIGFNWYSLLKDPNKAPSEVANGITSKLGRGRLFNGLTKSKKISDPVRGEIQQLFSTKTINFNPLDFKENDPLHEAIKKLAYEIKDQAIFTDDRELTKVINGFNDIIKKDVYSINSLTAQGRTLVDCALRNTLTRFLVAKCAAANASRVAYLQTNKYELTQKENNPISITLALVHLQYNLISQFLSNGLYKMDKVDPLNTLIQPAFEKLASPNIPLSDQTLGELLKYYRLITENGIQASTCFDVEAKNCMVQLFQSRQLPYIQQQIAELLNALLSTNPQAIHRALNEFIQELTRAGYDKNWINTLSKICEDIESCLKSDKAPNEKISTLENVLKKLDGPRPPQEDDNGFEFVTIGLISESAIFDADEFTIIDTQITTIKV